MIRASIDLGTNTCLLLVTEWDSEHKKIKQVLGDFSTVVRLGEGVDQARMLQAAPMERTLKCLKNYSLQLQELGGSPPDAVCVATSQARDAKNASEFFSQIESETGFRFRVISGEEEARSTFLGALLPGLDPKTTAVLDIGGGSTEMMSLTDAQSIDIGSVRFTERFLKSDPVTDPEFWACQDAIDQSLQELGSWKARSGGCKTLVGVAGTVTTLAAWYLGLPQFDAQKIDSVVLTRGDVHRMVEELKWRSNDERNQLPSMEPLRADVILAGALILWRTLEVLGFSECRVSTRGLRYGILLSSD